MHDVARRPERGPRCASHGTAARPGSPATDRGDRPEGADQAHELVPDTWWISRRPHRAGLGTSTGQFIDTLVVRTERYGARGFKNSRDDVARILENKPSCTPRRATAANERERTGAAEEPRGAGSERAALRESWGGGCCPSVNPTAGWYWCGLCAVQWYETHLSCRGGRRTGRGGPASEAMVRDGHHRAPLRREKKNATATFGFINNRIFRMLPSQMETDATERVDLFATASTNAGKAIRSFENTCEARPAHADTLRQFVSTATAAARMSMNMSSSKLRDFLERNKYSTALELAQRQAEKEGREVGVVYLDRQKPWGERRQAFEGCFQQGERFLYGALNLGNVGLEDYGDWCVVFGEVAMAAWTCIASLPDNSLERYTSLGSPIDRDGVMHDVAPWGEVPQVAAIKHRNSLPEKAPNDWPNEVCHDYTYVECIVVDEVQVGHIEALRIRDNKMARIWDLIERDITSKPPLTSAERDELIIAKEIVAFFDSYNLFERIVVA